MNVGKTHSSWTWSLPAVWFLSTLSFRWVLPNRASAPTDNDGLISCPCCRIRTWGNVGVPDHHRIRMPARGPHHSTMEAILKEMHGHAASWPFKRPVNTDEVKDYLDVVKKPMDLSLMDFKLENNAYATIEDFLDDAKLMLDNCKLYNPESTVYHKTAIRMEKALVEILKSVGVDYRV
ncbi:unnamed protein product [Rhizoctonia solani]|uniref:Bromo domain-containing protein n=1 Tax=Rhizoctonia solani TaxID=456999 RepID=A0A8H3GII6_9AGAM|nr:unnamed protein product [Rhizoctonia solani]